MKIIKKSSKKKKVLFAAMVLALVFGGGVVFAAINKVGPFAGQTSTDANNQINYDPPTDEQKESGDQAADKENADTSEDLPVWESVPGRTIGRGRWGVGRQSPPHRASLCYSFP
ncbi:hypothetical protein TM7_0125 [candidate division TM7 genomosp. GTL1]|nr:hypothetical protein TM7_0125 [candidate division TM7 genomosp. GTL1]